jgi:hypothetical protein
MLMPAPYASLVAAETAILCRHWPVAQDLVELFTEDTPALCLPYGHPSPYPVREARLVAQDDDSHPLYAADLALETGCFHPSGVHRGSPPNNA